MKMKTYLKYKSYNKILITDLVIHRSDVIIRFTHKKWRSFINKPLNITAFNLLK